MANHDDALVRAFTEARPTLMGVAYRMLGSVAEAEDVTQDTWLAWAAADHATIDTPRNWMITVATRKSLDALKSARRKRETYVGSWLPEPLQAVDPETPEDILALDQSVTTGFLVVLDLLAPKERAAFILCDVFDQPTAAAARTLGVSEVACRKLVSRARGNLRRANLGNAIDLGARPVPEATQTTMLQAFGQAIETGDTGALAQLLAQDVRLVGDGGGKTPSIKRPLFGIDEVRGFVGDVLAERWQGTVLRACWINGQMGFVQEMEMDGHRRTIAVISFEYRQDGQLQSLFILRNPDKLTHLQPENTETIELYPSQLPN